jgi:hypothetical protein
MDNVDNHPILLFMNEIDRKTAGRLLKVSIRTIDRYIAKKNLSVEYRNGRIWLNKKEILKLRDRKRVDNVDRLSTDEMSIDKIDVIHVDNDVNSDDTVYSHTQKSSHFKAKEEDTSVYRKLFEDLQFELKQKQERLEGANYRVGQLEALLKESVPLLDYKRDVGALKAAKELTQKNLDEKLFETEQLSSALKEEKLNKKVYLIILFILLLLQPLWFIFPLN